MDLMYKYRFKDRNIHIAILVYKYIFQRFFYRIKLVPILGRYIHTQCLVIQGIPIEQLGTRQYGKYIINAREFFPQTVIYH